MQWSRDVAVACFSFFLKNAAFLLIHSCVDTFSSCVNTIGSEIKHLVYACALSKAFLDGYR